jgi:hypothetical protein
MGIHQKIEHITARIKDMVNMMDRSVGKDELFSDGGELSGHSDQELTEDQQQELSVMILKMQENELPQKSFSRLEKQLSNDRRALKFYVEFTQICACLRSVFSKTSGQPKNQMAKTHNHG